MSPAKRRAAKKTAATDSEREVDVSGVRDDQAADAATPRGDGEAAEASLEERIRQRAYQIYCSRNPDDSTAMEDWLSAERELRLAHTSSEGRASSVLERLNRGQAENPVS